MRWPISVPTVSTNSRPPRATSSSPSSTLCVRFRRRPRVVIGFAGSWLQNVVSRCVVVSLTCGFQGMRITVSNVMIHIAGVYPHPDQCEPNLLAAGRESARPGPHQQRVLARLGRLDELRASGELDRLLASLGRFSEKLAVLGAHAEGDAVTVGARIVGPGLIFERLWQQLGIDRVLTELAGERRFGFSLERAVFVSVLHRLFAPGSDRAAEKW